MNMEQDLIPGLPRELAIECLIRVDFDTLFLLPSVCRRWQQEFRSPQFSRRRQVGGHSHPLLAFLILSHENDNTTGLALLFDPTSGKCRHLPPIPNIRRSEKYSQIVKAGQRIVLVGSPSHYQHTMPIFQIYEFYTSQWRSSAEFPLGHRDLAAIASDGINRIFVAGGRDRDNHCQPLRSAASYNVDDDSWCPLPDMAEARAWPTGIFNAGIFHVMSGFAHGVVLTTAEHYHLSTGSWSQESNHLEAPMHGWVCSYGNDGKCYHFNFNKWKLFVKEGESWNFVSDFPPEVQRFDAHSFHLLGWKSGVWICIITYWNRTMESNRDHVMYRLKLGGEEDKTLSCEEEMLLPFDRYRGVIFSTCGVLL